MHTCIQGWTGVPLTYLLQLYGASPEATYAVLTSYQLGQQAYPHRPKEALQRPYYKVLPVETLKHAQTILAYEMNGKPLPLEHGAPLRLRVETELGFKMVKYLRSIELVANYKGIWEGQGGFREDVRFYSMGAEIRCYYTVCLLSCAHTMRYPMKGMLREITDFQKEGPL